MPEAVVSMNNVAEVAMPTAADVYSPRRTRFGSSLMNLAALPVLFLAPGLSDCGGDAEGRPEAVEVETAVYPTGKCDTIKEGMPGLNDPENSPEKVKLLGYSVEDRPIWAEYWGPDEAETTYVILGQVHGNECSPTLFTDELRHADDLEVGFWLVPTLNPDGHANYTRSNANGVDLNNDANGTQPETRALIDFVDELEPDAVIHVHAPNAFVGSYGAVGLARQIAGALGFVHKNAGDHSNFLWKGLDAPSVLVELDRISYSETYKAKGSIRQPLKIEAVRAEARAVIEVLNNS